MFPQHNRISHEFSFPEGFAEVQVETKADCEQHQQAYDCIAYEFFPHEVSILMTIASLDEGALDHLFDFHRLLLDPLGFCLNPLLVVLLRHSLQVQQLQAPPDLSLQLEGFSL